MQKQKIIRPTPEEDRLINEGIAADPDNPEWTEEDFKRARPATRGPQKSPRKIRTNIRLSAEVVETYRGLGKGWQTRMNNDLLELIHGKYLCLDMDGHLVTVERVSENCS